MIKANLKRTRIDANGVFGLCKVGDITLHTLEHNFNGAPAVPSGTYTCIRHPPVRLKYETFMVTDVPGHSGILFHIGNYNHDSIGCILLGQGELVDKIIQSKQAFNTFMVTLAGVNEFTLEVL